jgi:hypothetical protein
VTLTKWVGVLAWMSLFGLMWCTTLGVELKPHAMFVWILFGAVAFCGVWQLATRKD